MRFHEGTFGSSFSLDLNMSKFYNKCYVTVVLVKLVVKFVIKIFICKFVFALRNLIF